MRIDLQAAESYLTALDETAEFFTWQTFDDAAKGRSALISIQHGALDDLSERLVDLNNRGAGIYICVNETDGKGRKIENVTRVRAVFADLDGAPLAGVYQCALDPHMIIESSPGKYHAYWLVDDLPLDQFKPIQQVIAARFESDPSVNDLPRILRVPGFIHRKGEPALVKIVSNQTMIPYTPDQIRAEFPPDHANKFSQYGAAPDTEAKGFHSHIAMIGHQKGGGGFHWPITRAIAAYVSQYGRQAPVEPLKAILRTAIDNADRSNYTDAQLANVKSNLYLDRAIHGALGRFGEDRTSESVEQVIERVEAVGGGKVVHLSERKRPIEPSQAWLEQLSRTPKGVLHVSIANIVKIFRHDPAWRDAIGWDQFSLKTLKIKPPPFELAETGEWTDRDDRKAVVWLSDRYELRPTAHMVAEAVDVVAEQQSFHPVREYLTTIEWDGVARVDSWLSTYLGAENSDYTSLIGRCWMVGAVARIMRPGCKMDNVIIFEGSQGKGKSQALALLGGDWFTDTPFDIGSKDGYLTMRGKWIIELAELDSFNRAESTRAKHFFAASSDTYREPYGRRVLDVQRQCVFAGTTNSDEYLKDDSGNRRYWPIRTATIRHKKLRDDRDQLWAEATRLYKDKAAWWIKADNDIVSSEQDKRFQGDAWEMRVAAFVAEKKTQYMPGSSIPFYVTIADILGDCLEIPTGRWTRIDQMRASSVLKRLGMIRFQVTLDGRRQWVYGPRFNE